MSQALVESRPVTVTQHGTTVWVSVHDATHYRERAQWARTIVEADRRGAGYFARRATAFAAWLLREWKWYRDLHLVPPQARQFVSWIVHTYGVLGRSIPLAVRRWRTGMLQPRRQSRRHPNRIAVVRSAD